MNIAYFKDMDSLYVEISPENPVQAWEAHEGIVLNLSEDGRVVGIEIEKASLATNPGPVNANFAPALLRESDGCKARRAGKGHPLPSGATPQTRFLAATRRDGPIRAHPFVASRLQCPHCGASRFAGCIPNRPRRRREISVNRPYILKIGGFPGQVEIIDKNQSGSTH